MDADEWPYWVALDQLSPIGSEQTNLLLGQILQLLANVNRDPKSPGIDLDRVMPWLATRSATLAQIDQGAIAIDPRIAALRRRLILSREQDGP